jgi:hypothetical protein
MRDLAGRELVLPNWDVRSREDGLGRWTMNLMLINVSTRKFRRAVRLPEGDVLAPAGAGVSRSVGFAAPRGVVGCAHEGKDGANLGWLGHRSITSTAVYTALAPYRFKDFWQD